MRTTLQGLGRVLAAGSAALALAACGGSSTPSSPTDEATLKAAAAAAAVVPVSATIRGSVVDSSNRLLANITIECLGEVYCTSPNAGVTAEGHEHRITKTDANGSFAIVATRPSGSDASGFQMNANGQGYAVAWRLVSWPAPACSSDRCSVTVNFSLDAAAEPAE